MNSEKPEAPEPASSTGNSQPATSNYHTPVLLDEILDALDPQPGKVMLDATLGGGGHSLALAQKLQPGGTLIGLDRDTDALDAARIRLAPVQNFVSIILLHTPFGNMATALDAEIATQNTKMDGILFDLGVSSHQLDTSRGFSFRRDENLDMRMDRGEGVSAGELAQTASAKELERIFYEYGEERWAKRIAQVMVERRAKQPIETTAQLAQIVEQSVPRKAWPRDIHVATRVFQALRIAVNDELGQLQAGLDTAIDRLKPGGRLAVISYHSLEDRIVKHVFSAAAGMGATAPGSSPAAFLTPLQEPILRLITRKPITPTEVEITRNPRARSAKLRIAEKRH